MGWLPRAWQPPLSRQQRIGCFVVAGGVLIAGGLVLGDQLLRRGYDLWRPRLERQLSRVLGHPVHFGAYEGIGFRGVRLGPGRIAGGVAEGSTASVQALDVSIDPLASLAQGALLVDLRFSGARLDLRANARGQVWVLPVLPPGASLPPIAYRFRLHDPLQVHLYRSAGSAPPLRGLLAGQVNLAPRAHHLQASLRAWNPGVSGDLALRGTGEWLKRRWQLELQPRQLSLQAIRPLLPAALQLQGQAGGRLQLNLRQGRLSCQGDLKLQDVRLRRRGMGQAISSPKLPLQCRGSGLQLERSPWQFGSWRGQIGGSLRADRSLQASITAQPPPALKAWNRPIDLRLRGRIAGGTLRAEQLELASGAARLGARGTVGPELALQGWWRLAPSQLLRGRATPAWLGTAPISGGFRLRGSYATPHLSLIGTRQASHPLLGPWQADASWKQGLLTLERFQAGRFEARATLPLAFGRKGLSRGPLEAWIALRDLPLSSLDGLVGTRLHGDLDAEGWLRGPLTAPVPDLELSLRNPGAGPLQLQEHWQGHLLGSPQGGAQLRLEAASGGLPGRITARLTPRWLPTEVRLERDQGALQLAGTPRRFQWSARGLPLHGLALLVDRSHPPQPVEGTLSGSGALGLQPLGFNGSVTVQDPVLFGLGGRLLRAEVHYADRSYRLRGSLQPLSPGTITGRMEGRWQGPFRAVLQARGLSSLLAQQIALAWQTWKSRGQPGTIGGQASELGQPAIATLGLAIDQQLQRLDQARERLETWQLQQKQRDRAARLAALQGRVDADLTLTGANLRQARAALDARGHLWLSAGDRDLALARDPFEVRLEGPLFEGEGTLSLHGLTLALLSLLTPVPDSLRGYLGAKGRYRLAPGRADLALELSLEQAQLGDRALSLNRGGLQLGPKGLSLDLALQPQGSSGSLDLTGWLPLDPTSEDLRLRLASRGDGVMFLSELAGPGLRWRGGSVDLQLLMRGSLRDPIANGFLRIRDGSTELAGQSIEKVQATVLFDFQQLLLQELSARVGAQGEISGDGKLALVRELGDDPTLTIKLNKVPFSQERIKAVADGSLELGGSLLAPQLGGSLRISQGTINPRAATMKPLLETGKPAASSTGNRVAIAEANSPNDLLQRGWNFREPLQLLGPSLNSETARSLEAGMPRLSWLRLANLRLQFGPDLRVVLPAIANFSTGGSLRLNGPLDARLTASGVVRLLKGRLNLFTTTFSLDPDTPNVAVFTPSQGLVPYLDIAMRSRIADNIATPLSSSLSPGESTALPILSQKDSQAGFSNFSQLNLVLVTVSVSGPADELAQSIRLRSTPPLPQERLLAMIGGNSLAGLQGGEAGTALAAAVGQSLLSPLLGSLTDALGQRLSLALYPTYVNQTISDSSSPNGERIAPQLVLAAEVGYDLTKRLNASLLAAPNRSDVPPQLNLSYKASNNLSIEGSLDSEGTWQTQLQLFLRF